ncbi:MAG: hypothetical protein D6806_00080 [Deltaproteobacteria bacterium]|nr:MAG: hypothetical protein D6806_00080 [Deltaproteobacteria bacterium]
MKRILMPMVALLLCSCVDYSKKGESCSTLAECNPGKDCGVLVKCIEGKCDPSQTVDLPCQKDCKTDSDCPEGMHCRISGESGTCAADGTCADVSECEGLEHDDCPGEFACRNGTCTFECLDITSCSGDSDCLLVGKGCCGPAGIDGYASIRADALQQWRNRKDCQLVDCEPCEYCPDAKQTVCWPEGCLEAFCDGGTCSQRRRDPRACSDDSECVKATIDCCSCENGGPEGTLNSRMVEAYSEYLDFACAAVGACKPAWNCTDRTPVCLDGLCTLQGDVPCQCPDVWNPVCVAMPNDALVTYSNECEARCDGHIPPWFYNGACECMMDCDGSMCGMTVCASNGQTYHCGEAEAQCNGQAVAYEGECSPECDQCLLGAHPPVPVCDENFCNTGDICFAMCHGLDWWHEGTCLPGEGETCGGFAGTACPDGFFCLITDGNPDAAGVCIKKGACLEDLHCDLQGLDPCPDDGPRVCINHSCTCPMP